MTDLIEKEPAVIQNEVADLKKTSDVELNNIEATSEQIKGTKVRATQPTVINGTLVLKLKKEHYAGDLPAQVVTQFTCFKCKQIVWKPVKCDLCETIVCKNCTNLKNNGQFVCPDDKCGTDKL